MCKIRLLVIGDSLSHNREIVKRVQDKAALYEDGKIQVVSETVGSFYAKDVTPEDYDIAIVDETTIAKNCCQLILGSGVPVLTFGDIKNGILSCPTGVLYSVVEDAIEKNLLCDYIEKVTEEIETTHKMIVSLC